MFIGSTSLRASIRYEGEPIPLIVEGKWMEALVHMKELDFLNFPQSIQVQILNKIRIQDENQLTSTFTLVGFQKKKNIQQPSFTSDLSFCVVDLKLLHFLLFLLLPNLQYATRPIFLYCQTQNQWLILKPHPNVTLFDQCVLFTRVLISSAVDVEVVVIHTVLVGVDLEHDYHWSTRCVCCSSYGSCLFMLISLLLLPMLLLYYIIE